MSSQSVDNGHDYDYREKVATQYKTRVILKLQLQKILIIICVPCAFVIGNLLQFPFITKLSLNLDLVGQFWQKIYIFSFFASLLGLASIKRNNITQLTLAIILQFCLGLLPLGYVAFKTLINSNRASSILLGFAFISLFLNCLALKQSYKLISSWKEVKAK